MELATFRRLDLRRAVVEEAAYVADWRCRVVDGSAGHNVRPVVGSRALHPARVLVIFLRSWILSCRQR